MCANYLVRYCLAPRGCFVLWVFVHIDKVYLIRYNVYMKSIIKYQLENGKIPFDEWFKSLDNSLKAKVLKRVERLKLGLYGNHRNLKKGISELKFESGERIYFHEENDIIVLLLNAGNKTRQSNDIKTAESYLMDYKERTKQDEKHIS